jgi:hypothetical protein
VQARNSLAELPCRVDYPAGLQFQDFCGKSADAKLANPQIASAEKNQTFLDN